MTNKKTITKRTIAKNKDNQDVIGHYLDYPYPSRNPEDEKNRLIQLQGIYIGEINHFLFNGKQDFQNNFRILIAGGGTGDAAIYLAEQLRHTNVKITYLDFSKNTMNIAKERAKIRGFKNITWVNDSILNIPKLNLGTFHFINCVGVLHHLPDPQEGLNILQESLTADGAMDIMVYAQIGRTGIYHIQDIMKMVNEGITNRQEEVKNCWGIINKLPKSNWYSKGEELAQDHKNYGDVGLYDMFLHKQDRAYTIPQLYEFVKNANLNFVDFTGVHSRIALRIENYIQDPDLLKLIKSKDIITQQAICELITGNIIKHAFYVSNKKDTIADYKDLDNVPYFYTNKSFPETIYNYIDQNSHDISENFTASYEIAYIGKINIKLPHSKYTKHLFKHLIPGEKSFREIFDAIREDLKEEISDEILSEEITKIIPPLQDSGMILLRHKSIDLKLGNIREKIIST